MRDKIKQLQEDERVIVNIIEGFLDWVDDITEEYEENPYRRGYGENYTDLYLLPPDHVTCTFEYVPVYDDYETRSDIIIPLDWLDLYAAREFNTLSTLVLKELEKGAKEQGELELAQLQSRAKLLGYTLIPE